MKAGPPIACNLGALDELQRNRRAELAAHLQGAVRKIIPTADGYTLQFSGDDAPLIEIAEFISLERLCCPFINFQISLIEGDDAITVHLGGRDGVKEFLAAEFGLEGDCRC